MEISNARNSSKFCCSRGSWWRGRIIQTLTALSASSYVRRCAMIVPACRGRSLGDGTADRQPDPPPCRLLPSSLEHLSFTQPPPPLRLRGPLQRRQAATCFMQRQCNLKHSGGRFSGSRNSSSLPPSLQDEPATGKNHPTHAAPGQAGIGWMDDADRWRQRARWSAAALLRRDCRFLIFQILTKCPFINRPSFQEPEKLILLSFGIGYRSDLSLSIFSPRSALPFSLACSFRQTRENAASNLSRRRR